MTEELRDTGPQPARSDDDGGPEPSSPRTDVDPRISKANEEAKRYRLQLREAEKQVTQMQTQLGDIQQQAEAERLARLRLEAAVQAGLPAEFAARLHGETPDALTEDARQLAAILPGPRLPRVGAGGDAPASTVADEIYRHMTRGNSTDWMR